MDSETSSQRQRQRNGRDEPSSPAETDGRFKADRDESRAPQAGADTADAGFSEAELRARLAGLPGWELAREGRILQRRYRMPHFRAALAFAGYVGEVAQGGQVEPEIVLGLASVQVRLIAAEGRRLGDVHLAFAAALDFTDP